MDGLDCSEIFLSHVKREETRFDSEYYSKENLLLQTIIDAAGNKTINEYGGVLDCSAFYPSITGYYSNDRSLIPFVRVNEIANGLISITDNTVFLPANIIQENSKTIAVAYPGDIIIAKGGNTLAKVGLVTNEYPMYATCRDVIILRTTNLQGLNRHYLWSFLHSTYGQGMLWRSASQTGQPHLTLSAITKLKVPEYKKLQDIIEKLYTLSVCKKQESNTVYSDAEEILLTSLCISEKACSGTGIAIRSISESFRVTGRLDAEYYQPKFESIAQKLNASETVLSLCKLYDKNFAPQDKESYQYIELADVGQSGDISDVDIQYGSDLPTRARRIVKAGQIIVSSVEGSLQSCALITNEYDGALCSTGFYVLDSDYINSETLLVLFKSEPIQALMKQRCSGTILTAISKDELLSMPLPMIDEGIQKEIAAKVQESFALRKQSKQLLEYAKQAVEMAIEQDEEVALSWLHNKVAAMEV